MTGYLAMIRHMFYHTIIMPYILHHLTSMPFRNLVILPSSNAEFNPYSESANRQEQQNTLLVF